MLSALSSFVVTFLVEAVSALYRDWQADRTARDAGRAEAAAAGAAEARESARAARESEADTAIRHRADPGDGAFDTSFRRD